MNTQLDEETKKVFKEFSEQLIQQVVRDNKFLSELEEALRKENEHEC